MPRPLAIAVHLLLAAAALLLSRPASAADDFAVARSALASEYAQKLAAFAEQCDGQQLAELAGQARAWLPKRDPAKLYLFLPQDAAALTDSSGGEPEARAVEELRVLQKAQAEATFELARRAIKERRSSLAWELLAETIRENPDHKQARRLLGYVKSRDRWQTPFEIKQQSVGKVWHERFGWLPKNHVARYEKGERFFNSRWMSAEQEAALRTDIQQGWRVESDHYQVTTNHSLEEGVKLARRLERLYSVWQQVFVGYLASAPELARRFEGAARPVDARQHKVVYFRSRDEYNAALKKAQPQIEITLGIYFDDVHTAYFFAGEDQQEGTVYHEATHQLFQESRAVSREVGRKSNFWIIEAIACYMESLSDSGGIVTLGGFERGRMPAARQRLVDDKFYVPLAELVRYGMEDVQHDANIAKLYSQSSGLATFLMHHDAGRYREPLVGYLDAVYSGRVTDKTLADLAGARYEDLDRQYREFVAEGDAAPARQ
jgi:hypothetical protein